MRTQVIVFAHVQWLGDQSQIGQALFQTVARHIGGAGAHLELHLRVPLPECRDTPGQPIHAVRLRAADCNRVGQRTVQLAHLAFHLARQLHQFLGALTQQPPFRGQRDLMWTPVEQRHAQRILQALELSRQRGLRDLQQLGRPGDVAFIGHRQEIPQHAQIHTRTDAPAIRVRGQLREIRRVLNTGRCVHIHIHPPTFSTPTGPHARRSDFQCNRPMSPERRRLVRPKRNGAGPGPAPVRSVTGKIGVRTAQRREHRGCMSRMPRYAVGILARGGPTIYSGGIGRTSVPVSVAPTMRPQ